MPALHGIKRVSIRNHDGYQIPSTEYTHHKDCKAGVVRTQAEDPVWRLGRVVDGLATLLPLRFDRVVFGADVRNLHSFTVPLRVEAGVGVALKVGKG